MSVSNESLIRLLIVCLVTLALLAGVLWYRPAGALVTEPPPLISGWTSDLPTAVILRPEVR